MEYKEFTLFTRNPGGSSKYVKDIYDFYAQYGKSGEYANSHHLTLEQLPDELKSRGEDAIRLAEKVQKLGGFKMPTQDVIDRIRDGVSEIKAEDRYTKLKLKKYDN